MRALPLLLLVSCAKSKQSTEPSPTDTPFRITITAAGVVTPTELVVPQGARVLFVNLHAIRHEMSSDPHPDHTDCLPINQVGLLLKGQSRETGNLVEIRTCGFHDHKNPDDRGLQGQIVVR